MLSTRGATVNKRDFYFVSSETKDCQNSNIISDEQRSAYTNYIMIIQSAEENLLSAEAVVRGVNFSRR